MKNLIVILMAFLMLMFAGCAWQGTYKVILVGMPIELEVKASADVKVAGLKIPRLISLEAQPVVIDTTSTGD